MTTALFAWENDGSDRRPVGVVLPDLAGLDSAEEFIRDAERCGILGRVRELLGCRRAEAAPEKLSVARDLAFELSCLKDPAFAIDLLAFVTGAGDYGARSLREYAERHACSHEWFRREADRMRARLDLMLGA